MTIATVFMTDPEYLDWLATHPDGYVLNLRKRPDPGYVVLHRATCPMISRPQRTPDAYTGRAYRKVGATKLGPLQAIAREHGRADGSFSKCCALCDPLGTPGTRR
jgi:hypothetical protein